MPCSLGTPKKAYVPWSFHNSLKSRIKTFCPATQASDMIREKGSPTSKGTLFPPSQPPKDLVSSCPLFWLTILFQLSAPLFTPGQAYLGLVSDIIHKTSVRSVCAEYNKQPSYLPRPFFFFFLYTEFNPLSCLGNLQILNSIAKEQLRTAQSGYRFVMLILWYGCVAHLRRDEGREHSLVSWGQSEGRLHHTAFCVLSWPTGRWSSQIYNHPYCWREQTPENCKDTSHTKTPLISLLL